MRNDIENQSFVQFVANFRLTKRWPLQKDNTPVVIPHKDVIVKYGQTVGSILNVNRKFNQFITKFEEQEFAFPYSIACACEVGLAHSCQPFYCIVFVRVVKVWLENA